MSAQKIKCIAFDLGGILVKVDLSVLQTLTTNTMLIQDAFFNQSDHHALTLGTITPNEYFSSVAEILELDEKKVQNAWRRCVSAFDFALQTLNNLGIPYVFWSNTDPIHFNTLKTQLQFKEERLAQSMFSFSDGVSKPDIWAHRLTF